MGGALLFVGVMGWPVQRPAQAGGGRAPAPKALLAGLGGVGWGSVRSLPWSPRLGLKGANALGTPIHMSSECMQASTSSPRLCHVRAGFHEFAEFCSEDVGTVDSGLNSVVLANNNE